MYKILLIAWRDYLATVRTKSFLIFLLLIPLLVVGTPAVLAVLSTFMILSGDTDDKHFAVIDRTPGEKLFPELEAAAKRRNDAPFVTSSVGKRLRPAFVLERIKPSVDDPEAIQEQRFELSERVLKGEFFGFVEIGPDVCSPPKSSAPPAPLPLPPGHTPLKGLSQKILRPTSEGGRDYIRYQTERITFQEFPLWADEAINQAILRQRWLDAGMAADKLPSLQPVALQTEGLTQRDAATGTLHDAPLAHQLAGHLIPGCVVILMFMAVMIGTGPAMQSVVEEKMQRISEVLLGSVDPFELMMGKLIGLTAISLTISVVYLGAAFVGGAFAGLLEFLPVAVLIWFVPYQILALMMYGSLSLAIGAAAKDLKATQPYILPVAMLATLPMFFLVPILQQPNSAFATVLSFFPFATPMLMIARLSVPPGVPWWQPAAAIVPMALTTLACVYAAGRVFRIGILMQGKGASVSDLVRWVVRG